MLTSKCRRKGDRPPGAGDNSDRDVNNAVLAVVYRHDEAVLTKRQGSDPAGGVEHVVPGRYAAKGI